MPKILAFSDLHAHPFKPYATFLENGLNSRLVDAVSCINQIYDYASNPANEVDLVLFGGDLFHERRHIVTQAFNAVFEALSKFTVNNIPMLMIHGNHDQADLDGKHHSLYTFGSFFTVVDTPQWVVCVGRSGRSYAVLAVPYVENAKEVMEIVNTPIPYDTKPDTKRIFLGHLGLQGAEIGSDFVYKNPHDCSISDLSCDKFDVGFLGHFHKFQQLSKNFWYVGAPLQHNWGDRGQSRGFVVYDFDKSETLKLTHVPLSAPRFREIDDLIFKTNDWQSVYKGIETDCFVRVVSQTAWSDDRKQEAKEVLGARSLEVITPRETVESTARVVMNADTSYIDMIHKYVNSVYADVDGLDVEYLTSLGTDIMHETEDM